MKPMYQMAAHVVDRSWPHISRTRSCQPTTSPIQERERSCRYQELIIVRHRDLKLLEKPEVSSEGTLVAYAKRNPMSIYALSDRANKTLESVLHLPFEPLEEPDTSGKTRPTQPQPSREDPHDWLVIFNLGHIEGAETCHGDS